MEETTVALTVGLTLGVLFLLIIALICCCGRGHSLSDEEKQDREESDHTESEVHPDSAELEANESNERDIEQDIPVEAAEDEGPPEKHILTTLDVHTCASTICEVCRKQQTPTFVSAIRLPPGMEGRIRSLPDRWWEKNYDSDAIATMMTVGTISNNDRVKRTRSERPRRRQDIAKEYPEDET
jgi:hypothetical protein